MIGSSMVENDKKIEIKPPRAADYLNGESPRERGAKKQKRVLDWIYRWGYSSAEIIKRVAGQQMNGYAKGLAKKGLLVESKTESGTPRFIYTLSKTGLEEATRFSEFLLRYPEEDWARINQQQIRHNLLAQAATIHSLDIGSIYDYLTERMYDQDGDKSGIKRPDVVWKHSNDLTSAIEIELSPKWDRRLDEFVYGVYQSLRSPAKYNRYMIVTDSPALITRYKEALSPGKEVKIWKKNSRGHWDVEKKIENPDWLLKSIDFFLLEK